MTNHDCTSTSAFFRRSLLWAALCVLPLAGAANAATIVVTTQADLVADDGLCSLREAVSAVNEAAASGASPGECPAGDGSDTIELPEGRYRLDLGVPGDDDNGGGDLDVLRSVTFMGQSASVVVEAGYGSSGTFGDGDRVFHVDPTETGTVDVAFLSLLVRGGEAWCDGADCEAGAGAIEAVGAGNVLIEDCVFEGNSVGCSGEDCGVSAPSSGAAAVRAGPAGNLVLRRTVFTGNRAYCSSADCSTGQVALAKTDDSSLPVTTTSVEEVVFEKNEAACEASNCSADHVARIETAELDFDGVLFERNRTDCEGEGCRAESVFWSASVDTSTVSNVSAEKNKVGCSGLDCTADRLLDLRAFGGLDLAAVQVVKNDSRCEGEDCSVEHTAHLSAIDVPLDLTNVEFTKNKSSCKGLVCEIEQILETSSGTATYNGVTIAKHRRACKGTGCSVSNGVRVGADDADVQMTVDANKFRCVGAGCFAGGPVVVDADTTLVTGNSTFTKNRSSCGGNNCDDNFGGLYVIAETATLDGVTLSKNRTPDGVGAFAYYSRDGGGTATLRATTITDNRARFGGGILVSVGSFLVLEDATVTGNRARRGGGILNDGTVVTPYGPTTVVAENKPENCLDSSVGTGCPVE